ncbi:MAG TPA: ribbon-helix-helix domain-containing protein [Steroidobacteraceae bacterium]|nr:ribbon-helix-helix domain-containing protein [Steroidobacteraceae bacterium]
MTTKRTALLAHVDGSEFKLLTKLAADTRIPRSALVREAVHDLLKKHGVLKPPRRKV